MRKFLVIVFAAGLSCISVHAQWYLFPGAGRSVREEPGTTEEEHFQDAINLSILLPLDASGEEPNANFLEMYCGALMAVRDLGNSGLRLNVSVFDTRDGQNRISPEQLSDSHIIFGPIFPDEILEVSSLCPDSLCVISPLDPKAADFIDSCRIIQSPSSWTRQIDDMVNWIREEMTRDDRLVVMADEAHIGEQSSYLLSRLNQEGLNFSMFGSTNGLRVQSSINTRFVIASDDDDYINITVRELGNIAARKNNMFLYTTSRVRNSLDAEAKHLYNLHTRLTAAYFIDYSDDEVKDFILKYRSLFNAEPGSFAFQGYDAIRYFTNACAKFGKNWPERLPEYSERGLQTDYKFHYRFGNPGQINTAVRRIIYNRDMSTQLQ